jgi:hypothetical protein
MEAGSNNGSDWRPELAAVSGPMPYEPEQSCFDACVRASAYLSVRLPLSMVARAGCCDECRESAHGSKRHETMREPMERRQGGGNDQRPELATVSGAMPRAPRLGRRALRGVRSGSGSSSRLAVGFSVPMVAAVGSSFRAGRAGDPASR